MTLSQKTYELLKRAAMVWLPALATLYGAVSAIWGLPATAAVIGTIVAIDTFLGVLLGVSTSLYNAGASASGIITVNHGDPTKGRLSLNFTQDLDELEKLGTVVFKVVHSTAQTAAPVPGGATSAPGHPVA